MADRAATRGRVSRRALGIGKMVTAWYVLAGGLVSLLVAVTLREPARAVHAAAAAPALTP